jgi:branched-chain amino acid transport system permease protein
MTALASQHARRTGLDIPAILKEAGLTALIALALTFPLVGLRTVDVASRLTVSPRFTEVAIAVALVFIGRIGLILTREKQAIPVLVVSLALAAAAWFLPFPSTALKVIAISGALIIAIRAAFTARSDRSTLTQQERDRAMDRLGARVQDAAVWIGPIAIVFAVILPFLPFANRSVVDIGILILTYIMLGWGLNIVVGLAGLLDLGYVAFYAVGA